MGTKKVAKKTVAKKPAAKRLPHETRRGVPAEPWDDHASGEAGAALHERVEPRELSHERLRNAPEETAMPAADDDLVDDVAAGATVWEGGATQEGDDA